MPLPGSPHPWCGRHRLLTDVGFHRKAHGRRRFRIGLPLGIGCGPVVDGAGGVDGGGGGDGGVDGGGAAVGLGDVCSMTACGLRRKRSR